MSDHRSSSDDPNARDSEPPLPPHLDPRRGQTSRRSSGSGRSPAGRSAGRRSSRSAAPAVAGRHSRSAGRPARTRRRSSPWATAIKVIAAVVSIVVLVTSGVMWGFYRDFNGKVERLAVTKTGGGGSHDIDGEDQNILLVGNDSRRGLTPEQLKEVGTTADPGLDTDTILLIHLPADGTKATVISFPRDSWVKIPGFADNRINAAYADGACPDGCGNTLSKKQEADGADQLIKTVSQLTGVQIDHYAEVSLLGFYTISNIIGGVDVCLAHPAYDPGYTNLNLAAGHHTLKGTEALLFVRQRHHLAGGDLDRIVRQQVFISALLRKVLSAGTLINPIKLHRLTNAVAKSLKFDETLNPLKLAEQMRDIAAGNVSFSTIPTEGPARIDGKDVIATDPAKIQAYVRKVIGKPDPKPDKPAAPPKPVPTVAPSQVNVAVYNGTTTPNLAGKTGSELSSAGYTVAGTANADRNDYSTTEIRYAAGQEAAAHTLQKAIPGATMHQEDSLGATIDLVLGTDFTGLHDASSSNAGSSAAAPPASSANDDSDGDTKPRTAADAGCID
ncbi:MAG TPA: LCP family protein [Mycobacteriales bacterium]|nr:LCP family protein [Mycobacteriales bacterium]